MPETILTKSRDGTTTRIPRDRLAARQLR